MTGVQTCALPILTPEELTKAVQDHTKGFFASMKAARVPKPQFPSTKEEVDKAWKMVEILDNPPKLIGDYERQIEKAHKRREDPRLKSSSPPRSVAQLGQQKNQGHALLNPGKFESFKLDNFLASYGICKFSS